MDRIIIASRGGYVDRSEFLAEALRDRIEAEEEGLPDDYELTTVAAAPGALEEIAADGGVASDGSLDVSFGDWLDSAPPTLPLAPGPPTNFGLHNRDWPTLLAADWLGRLSGKSGEPVDWSRYTETVIRWAWEYAAMLQHEDLDRPRGAKVAAGFPTNRKKPEATEMRFREHFLGTLGKHGNQGPLFIFGLIGVDGGRVALSAAGLDLLRALYLAGAAVGPPFSAAAWRAFAAHLRAHAPQELDDWLRVLAIVEEGPDRRTLVRRCDWWEGAAADTNSMSLIARGREWGLVELALAEGRYQLTKRGTSALRAEREEALA